MSNPSYAAVTPTRNESENLLRLAQCMVAQTVPPSRWVIVDNGSTDHTVEIARTLAETHPWISLVEIPGELIATRGAPVVRAFEAGLAVLDAKTDVVVKLDADVSFGAAYFSHQMAAFARDPKLGIAGGICMEPQEGDGWHAVRVTRDHVRGAIRAYRLECLQQVTPLEQRMGWDGIDELKAQVNGWTTQTLPDLCFYHHRVLGSRESGWLKWARQGETAYFMGYRGSYLLARTAYQLWHDPRAVAMTWAYLRAALTHQSRCSSAAAIAHLRDLQKMRSVATRACEKLGLAP